MAEPICVSVDPEGQLGQSLIDEFLRARGYDATSVQALPPEAQIQLLTEASVYASAKLAEVNARAHFVHELHGETSDY